MTTTTTTTAKTVAIDPYVEVRPIPVRVLNISKLIIAAVRRHLPVLLRRRQRAAQHAVVLLLLLLQVLVLLVFVLLLLELSLHVLLLLLLLVMVLLVLIPIGVLHRLIGLRLEDRTNRLIQQFAYSIVFRRFFQLYSRVKSSQVQQQQQQKQVHYTATTARG